MYGLFLLVLAPYVFSNPPAFLSATILYYLTEHARGDSTALWYFVPQAMQPVFQLIGYAAVLAIIYFAGRRKNMSLLGVLATCFIANAVFIAFNRMMHLNYV